MSLTKQRTHIMESGNKAVQGVILTSLKKIPAQGGDVLHALKRTDVGYRGFGEAYFSCVKSGAIKGWKRHNKQTLNIVVPVGEVRFVIHDDRLGSSSRGAFQEIALSRVNNFQRLTVAPGLWMAFQGISRGLNILLNIIDLEHDPSEMESLPLHKINFDWQK